MTWTRLVQANQIHEIAHSLANQILRGMFSLQVMHMLKVTHISLSPTEAVASVL